MNAPCYKCRWRAPGCHVVCKEYIGYQAKLERDKPGAKIKREVNQCINDISTKNPHNWN